MPKAPSIEEVLAQAFKKLDERVQKEKTDAQRQEQFEKFKIRQEEEEKKRKRQERIIYSCVSVFLVAISYVIYQAKDTPFVSGIVAKTFGGGGGSSSVSCSDANSWKNPACVEERQYQINSRWEGMMLNKGGKEKPFNLHGDKKD